MSQIPSNLFPKLQLRRKKSSWAFDEAGNPLLPVCQIVVNGTISVAEGFLVSFCIEKFNVPGLQNKDKLANLAGRTVFIFYLFFEGKKSASPNSPKSCKWTYLSGKRFFIFIFIEKFARPSLPKKWKLANQSGAVIFLAPKVLLDDLWPMITIPSIHPNPILI